jgi:hypothetical protein
MLYFEKSGGVGDVVCALLEAKHSSQAAHTEAGPSMMAEQITHLPSEFIDFGNVDSMNEMDSMHKLDDHL